MEGPTAVIYQQDNPVLVHRPAVLRVTAGPDKGNSCDLGRERVVVGTASDCGLVLTDSHVSRLHAELVSHDKGYMVRDLGSTNGTSYRGARVHEAVLGPGAEVRVGATVLRLEVGDPVSEAIHGSSGFGELIGSSPAMQQVYGLLAAVAPTEATVLIEGETGTGKELAAEALHRQSPRAEGSFHVLDCGAIPANLVESELFGHEKGAFTDATQAREGVFERARGGTVFLDEISELPLALQTRLLRVLDRRQLKRVGSNMQRRVDVRLVAASNRELHKEVQQGRFREDLFYRLAVIRIVMPPLRQRRQDIAVLARRFLWQAGCASPDNVLTPQMTDLLKSRQWRGNVRELRNAVEEAVLMADSSLSPTPLPSPPPRSRTPQPDRSAPSIEMPHVPAPVDTDSDDWLVRALPRGFLGRAYKDAKEELLERFERLYMTTLLRQHGANVSRLAREAKVDRQIIRRLLRRHGLGDPE